MSRYVKITHVRAPIGRVASNWQAWQSSLRGEYEHVLESRHAYFVLRRDAPSPESLYGVLTYLTRLHRYTLIALVPGQAIERHGWTASADPLGLFCRSRVLEGCLEVCRAPGRQHRR